MNIRTELMEYLIRQCVCEVLDQMNERAQLGVKEGEDEKKPDDALDTPAEPSGPTSQPETPSSQPEAPEASGPEGSPAEPSAETPSEPSAPAPSVKGAMLVNPKDKSKLQPVKLQGLDDARIERTLHQLATSIGGARTKVSISAKRLAREAARNESMSVYFYLGKMDPESEEIFLLADKSLQIAKDDSVQPGDLTGAPVTTLPPSYQSFDDMNDKEYINHLRNQDMASPRHAGIDENAKAVIKRMVNKILDGNK